MPAGFIVSFQHVCKMYKTLTIRELLKNSWATLKMTSFVDHLCYFGFVFVMLFHLFIAALWSPAGKWLTCYVYLCFCHFPMLYPGSGVTLDCIDSRSLPPFLL